MIRASIMLLLLGAILHSGYSSEDGMATQTPGSIYDIMVKDIMGNELSLSDFEGSVLLIVNTASRCGFTKQYEGLEALYQTYKDSGFIVLGFPANNFMNQEPGTNEEIKTFCTTRFNVTFPLFSKISVKGDDIHPLYVFLTDRQSNPEFGDPITWNFNKFLIGKDGSIIGRFDTRTEPQNDEIVTAIEEALAAE